MTQSTPIGVSLTLGETYRLYALGCCYFPLNTVLLCVLKFCRYLGACISNRYKGNIFAGLWCYANLNK